LGTSRVITTSTGTICYDADFYPYGGERDVVDTCEQTYKFEGKERDPETGNDNFGARYYTSRLGRWLSADWSAIPAPVPYANLGNPQTLNLYAMVHDNPETFADLDGHIADAAGQLANPPGDTSTQGSNPNAQQQDRNDAAQPKQQQRGWFKKALSYFYFKHSNGIGLGVTVKVGPAKVGVKSQRGEETTFTTSGKVTSSLAKIGATMEVAGVKVGLGREETQVTAKDGVAVNGEAKTDTVLGFETGKFRGENAEIGVGVGGCVILCGEVEVGIQGDKVINDLENTFLDPGPPPPPSAPAPPTQ
jgi:RHS repeat-associated protein